MPGWALRTGQRTPLPYPHAYTRVKDFLKEKLQKDLAHYVANPDSVLATSIFKVLSAAEVASGLRHQLEAFWHGEWPFNQQVKDGDPLAWWESLQDHPHACVLAALKDRVSTDPVSIVSTVDLSSVLESLQAAMMVTDDGDADWNY
ncbi:hypothetical protein BD769DRAFT_1637810 [Suillus cothurnatus]|nr:hypothetical protein BD769DRAFT_1637810 [Suillus cothurnatus]